jgi:hypothetical protein
MASLNTGLYIGDLEMTPDGRTTSPIIPEWLQGFDANLLDDPTAYMTMCAGKCWYDEVFVDETSTDTFETKALVYDRKMPSIDDQGGAYDRAMLEPYDTTDVAEEKEAAGRAGMAMERMKDFVACASCAQTCKGGTKHGLVCDSDDDCVCDPNDPNEASDCSPGRCFPATTYDLPPLSTCPNDPLPCAACEAPSTFRPPTEAELDRQRLIDRDGEACDAGLRRPFFIEFQPYIPHESFSDGVLDEYCPYFPRDEVQCKREPWKSHSVYCRFNAAFDADGDDAGDDGVPDYPEDYPRCAYIKEKLDLIAVNIAAEGRTEDSSQGLSESRKRYLRFINVFDRAVDDLIAYMSCPVRIEAPPGEGDADGLICDTSQNLLDNTVIIHPTDNGYFMSGSKHFFKEDGYRSPMVVALPGGQRPATCRPGGAVLPGCRREFAHSVDILATIRDYAGGQVDPTGCPPDAMQCSPEPPQLCCSDPSDPADVLGCCLDQACCTLDGPDGESRYDEGRSLADFSGRDCVFDPQFTPELSPPVGDPKQYRQCLVGSRRASQYLNPTVGWYVLAEVEEPVSGSNPRVVHYCKYVREGGASCTAEKLYDLRLDPNEGNNLINDAVKCLGGARDGEPCTATYHAGPDDGCPGIAGGPWGICNYCATGAVETDLRRILRYEVESNGWFDQSTCSECYECSDPYWPRN